MMWALVAIAGIQAALVLALVGALVYRDVRLTAERERLYRYAMAESPTEFASLERSVKPPAARPVLVPDEPKPLHDDRYDVGIIGMGVEP